MQHIFGFSHIFIFPFCGNICWNVAKENKCYLQLAWRTPYFCATFHARVRILHVMRAYRFSTVSSRLSSFQVFSHGSHFPFACLQIFALLIRAAAALTGGVRAKILPHPPGELRRALCCLTTRCATLVVIRLRCYLGFTRVAFDMLS